MSSSTIMDSFDAPMLDYSGDMDVHMHTTVSSPKPWTQPETIMEEDVHPIHLPNPFPSHLPQQDVEIDMDDYYNENVEYEMADGEIAVPDTELVDIDVYDATRDEAFSGSASVVVSHTTDLANQGLVRKLPEDQYPSSDNGVAPDHIPAVSSVEPTLTQSAHSVEPELLTPTPLQATVVQSIDTKSSDHSTSVALRASTPPPEAVSKDTRADAEASAAVPEGQADSLGIAVADGTTNNVDTLQPLDDSEQKRGPELSTAEHESSTFIPRTVTPSIDVEESSHRTEIPDSEPHEAVRSYNGSYENEAPAVALESTEIGEPEHPASESHEAGEEDNADPHEISEGVYIEPPPPVLIELPSTLDQPVCALFNAPPDSLSDDTKVNSSSIKAPYTILLQSRPTLYYETLNEVFDALREEDRIQTLTEFVEGEMVIDAYDVQLVMSEDNVHAREISLHDINVLHHGLGLIGPLRLRLRTVLSRFMRRYRGLQDQITRFNIAGSANPPADDPDEQAYVGPSHEEDSDYHQATNDDNEERQTERDPLGHGGQQGPAEVDEREDESTFYGNAEYQGEHEREAYDESEQYADAQGYPQAHEDETGAREETDQFVANDESETASDADPTHEEDEGLADPESTKYPEGDQGHEEDEVSGEAEVASVVIPSTHAKEDVSQSAEPDVLTEVRESLATGEPRFEESEERQASNDEISSSAGIDEDGLTEDAEAEADVTGDESTQSTEPENNLAVIANEDEPDAASHDDAGEYDAQDAELATPAILLRGEYSEPTNPSHHTAEDEENAESWELDDGYAVWDETFDGDEFDSALAGEPDSVSSGSSTLSGKTASITSKRSFDVFDEDEPTVEQSLSQNPKKTRMR